MAARTRTNAGTTYPGGTIRKVSTGTMYTSTGGIPTYTNVIEDITGDGTDGHFLDIRKMHKNAQPIVLNGPGKWSSASSFYTTGARSAAYFAQSFLESPSDTVIGTKTMAGTNPSRPVADIPVALLELGTNIGFMAQSWYRNVKRLKEHRDLRPGNIAEANLIIQFGLIPIISDVQAVLEFSSNVDKRVAEINKMVEQGGLSKVYRKKTPFVSSTHAYDPSYSINSSGNGPSISVTREISGTESAWGFAKWEPIGHSLPKDAAAMRRLVGKAVLGLTWDVSSLWEVIPFSWLIDYGFSIGSYFAAHRNLIPAYCTQLYVCRHTQLTAKYGQGSDDNAMSPPFTVVVERKTRRPVSFTSPAAHLPFLDGQKMSIIASLGVLKMR